ncbi:MAG: glycosyltransferase [Terrimicrobiaceae bacterium]
MRFLFLHPNFPSQHGPFASFLGRIPGNEVVFLTTADRGNLPGVRKILYQPAREARRETHHYMRGLETSVLHGQAAFQACVELRKSGWMPDVIFGHSGWGSTLYMKDVFPGRPLLCNFEWFYHAHGTDSDFDPAEKLTADDEARIRTKNVSLLLDLASSDGGVVPMHWQKRQFPNIFDRHLTVLHEGIDTDYHQPAESVPLVLPRVGLDLSGAKEIVTYVSRGFEPYRGFPQAVEAIAEVLEKRPEAHVVLVGEDRAAYGKAAPDGKTWKQITLEKFPLDPARAHFTGPLTTAEYRTVLQASSAHLYLTRPFVLSWSCLEALSAGCALVASRTPPVEEVVEDGVNGILVDFFQPRQAAQAICTILENPDAFKPLRKKARETVVTRYAIRDLWPRRYSWMNQFAR